MWRFILVTFAFLGWSFYELSGGSDYAPRAMSIQARAKVDDVRPVPRPERVNVIQVADDGQSTIEDTSVTRLITTINDFDPTAGDKINITLASASGADSDLTETGTNLEKVNLLTKEDETPVVPEMEASELEPIEQLDIRRVTGKVVNMRSGPGTSFDRIAKLTKGAEVEVMQAPEDGWINLRVVETGEIGWMADWLVTAAN